MLYLDWVSLIIFEGREGVLKLLVDWDLLAFGASVIEIGRCIDNLEIELIVNAVHVSVC